MLLWMLAAYVIAGAIFAVAFVVADVERVDSQEKGTGSDLALLIFPGAAFGIWRSPAA